MKVNLFFKFILSGLLSVCMCVSTFAQKQEAGSTVFKVDNLNFKKSPYSGMTREHWKEASLYFAKGCF